MKNSGNGTMTSEYGLYHIKTKQGHYTIVASAIGFETSEKVITILDGERIKINFSLAPKINEIEEVEIVGSGVKIINNSAFNAIAVDTKKLSNTTQDLSDDLNSVSVIRIREEGGLG